LTDKFPEKSWTKLGDNKLLKKLRGTGTVDRRLGSGRPHSSRTEEIGIPSFHRIWAKLRNQERSETDECSSTVLHPCGDANASASVCTFI